MGGRRRKGGENRGREEMGKEVREGRERKEGERNRCVRKRNGWMRESEGGKEWGRKGRREGGKR